MRARLVPTILAATLVLAARPGAAQQPGEAVAQPAEAAPPPPPPEPLPPPPPPGDMGPMATTTPPASSTATDHDTVVRHWGVEARRLATVQKTNNQDQGCKGDCPVALNALSLRRWSTANYAWSAGLALGLGGGSTDAGMGSRSWDTYFGMGPTVGATFLLANWKHLAVGISPQVDFVFFMPGGTRPKTFLVDARGLFEGELHLGFMGLPQVSLGLVSGLDVNFTAVTDAKESATMTATQWSLGFTGPTSLWGLVTNAFLRFYF